MKHSYCVDTAFFTSLTSICPELLIQQVIIKRLCSARHYEKFEAVAGPARIRQSGEKNEPVVPSTRKWELRVKGESNQWLAMC